jgi:SAM-dependent methyltransferase
VLGIKPGIRRLAQPIHHRFRSGKSDIFLGLLDRTNPGRLLDVGGGTGISGEFLRLYGVFESVTIANLSPPDQGPAYLSNVRIINADGRQLPFADGAFEWVFSNAVIEHVGDWEDQRHFANEIRRVASKGYFVTTPNRYFPIEPHALLPLYQFYPDRLKPLALRISPGYMKEVENINLLTPKRLQRLFPEAQVRCVNFASSIIAYSSESLRSRAH